MSVQNQRAIPKSERGLTLIETLMMVLLISLVLIAVPISLRSGTQVWEKSNRHNETLQNALIGMEELTRELRQAKEILAVSPSAHTNGFIEFKYYHDIDGDGDTVDSIGNREFKYQRYEYDGSNDYLQHGWANSSATNLSSNLNPLAGPVNGLSFTCYRDQLLPATIPGEIDQIREVHIKMTTCDDQGKVNPIPLSARVYLRTWIMHKMTDDFAIFGDDGVELQDQPVLIGSFPFQPSNVGANADIIVGQHNTVNGALHHAAGGNLIAQENDVYWQADYGYDEYILMPCVTNFGDPKWWNGIDPPWNGADPTIDNGNVKLKNGQTVTIPPGRYGDVSFGNNATLIMSAGTYWFTSISAKNNDFLHFDVSSGDVRVFVDGIVDLGNTFDASNTLTVDVEGGGAENVYSETHYGLLADETDPAWCMGNNTIWSGGIYAPYGDIALTDGVIYGQLISAETVTIHGGSPTQIPGIDTTEINFVQNNHIRDYGSQCFGE